MSTEHKKAAEKKTRQRKLPALDTAEGKQVTNELFAMMLEVMAEKPDLCDQLIQPPIPDLAWTVRLPGYDDARNSAVDAYLRILTRSELFREWCTSRGRPDPASFILKALGYGLGSTDYLLRPISMVTSADHLKRSRQVTAALRSRKERPIRDRWALSLPKPPCGYHLASIITGKLQHSLELYLPLMWTGLGLWLATAEDATAFLKLVVGLETHLRGLPVPGPGTYGEWVRELKLRTYEGGGRIIYGGNHPPQANATLRREAGDNGSSR